MRMTPRITTVTVALTLAATALSCAAAPSHPAGTTPTTNGGSPPAGTPAPDAPRHDGLAKLTGRSWVLRAWRTGEAFAGKPVVTLGYADGRISGRSACNRYSAPARAATPGALALGPIAGTRMACPAAVMAVESRFLAALGRVESWALAPSGDLELGYVSEQGAAATLTFSEVTARQSD